MGEVTKQNSVNPNDITEVSIKDTTDLRGFLYAALELRKAQLKAKKKQLDVPFTECEIIETKINDKDNRI